jgi:hypothetical protein
MSADTDPNLMIPRSAYRELAADNERLRAAMREALDSLATGPLKAGYAATVLGEALEAGREQRL